MVVPKEVRARLGVYARFPHKANSDTLDVLADALISANRIKGRPDECLTSKQIADRQLDELPLGEMVDYVSFRRTPSGLKEISRRRARRLLEEVCEKTPAQKPRKS